MKQGLQKGYGMEFIDQIKDSLSTFSNATNIALQLMDEQGETIESFGDTYTYCTLFREASGKYCPCFQMHLHSCKQAASLGEGYIFSCPGGLIHFAVPIMRNNAFVASVLAGPITLEYSDITLIDEIIQKHNLSLDYRSKLFSAYGMIPLIEPYRARPLSKLLFLLVTNLTGNEQSRIQIQSEKTLQQAKIGEYLQLIKEDNSIPISQYEMEKQLIMEVLSGDINASKKLLNEMLGRIYFTSGNNIEIIKTRSIELVALLSRAVIEGGGSQEDVYQMTDSFLHSITRISDLTDLSYLLLETLESFTNLAFAQRAITKVPALRKAVQFINENYQQNLTLDIVARHINLNPAYFSSLFKKEMQISFSNYILQRRIEQAKRLLKNSNLSLVDIAINLGFETQSYFSNTFKKSTGMTPKEYRYHL